LDVSQALAFLSETAFDFFTSHFVGMGPARRINTQTASDIAKTLTLGIIEPIAKQIDPLLLGRVDCSMKIAEAYSERLKPSFKDIKKLVEGYPSHEFVIDFEEAKTIFESVREPTTKESRLEHVMRIAEWIPSPAHPAAVLRLSEEVEVTQDDTDKDAKKETGVREQPDSHNGEPQPKALGTEDSERVSR
jgi:ribosomal protein S17E